MLLPINLLLFWYPKAAVIFLRSLRNIVLVLEEDLAVGLMLRLLFVPLFHDASIVGRVLSFIFRLSRVFIGTFGFLCAVLIVFLFSLVWFIAPFLLIVLSVNLIPIFPLGGAASSTYSDFFLIANITLVLIGIAIFIYEEMHKNIKPVWKIASLADVWKTTKLSQGDVTWEKLLLTFELKMFLKSLELVPHNFSKENIPIDDELLGRVVELAKKTEAKYITASYFWVAMLEQVHGVENELLKIDLDLEDFRQALGYMETARNRFRKIF